VLINDRANRYKGVDTTLNSSQTRLHADKHNAVRTTLDNLKYTLPLTQYIKPFHSNKTLKHIKSIICRTTQWKLQ